MMNVCCLVKAGYGSMREIVELDTPEFLDALEFESMGNAVSSYKMKQAKGNKG